MSVFYFVDIAILSTTTLWILSNWFTLFFSINLLSWAPFNVVYYHIAALTGNYVNFGVFELYGDRALADALDIALKMMLSISLADILAYRKV